MRMSVLLLSCVFLTPICTTGTYTVEHIGGVKHIRNHIPLWDIEPPATGIELEYVRTLGGPDETDENYRFFFPYDVEVDKYGSIYILDMRNHRIQKFDNDGNYLLTIGREGEGPGEFRNAFDITINDHGGLIVPDSGNRRLSVFSGDGKYVREIPAGNAQFTEL